MKRDKLVTFWSKRERDFMTRWPRYKADAFLMHGIIRDLVPELEKRGYDTTTLRFSVNLLSPESEKEPRS